MIQQRHHAETADAISFQPVHPDSLKPTRKQSDVAMSWTDCPVVEQNAEILSGAPVVRGTRIPVSAIAGNIEDGATVDQVVEWFPGLTVEDVRVVLRFLSSRPPHGNARSL